MFLLHCPASRCCACPSPCARLGQDRAAMSALSSRPPFSWQAPHPWSFLSLFPIAALRAAPLQLWHCSGKPGPPVRHTTPGSPGLPTTIALPKFRDSFPEWPQWFPRAGLRLRCTAVPRRLPASQPAPAGRGEGRQLPIGQAASAELSFSFPLLKKISVNSSFLSIDFPVKTALCLPLIPTLQENKPYKRNGYPRCLRD